MEKLTIGLGTHSMQSISRLNCLKPSWWRVRSQHIPPVDLSQYFKPFIVCCLGKEIRLECFGRSYLVVCLHQNRAAVPLGSEPAHLNLLRES